MKEYKVEIIGMIVFLVIGAWMATLPDPVKDCFKNYQKERPVYMMSAIDLVDRIIAGDQSFMLLDIRREKDDKKINIDRATPLAFEEFEKDDTLATSFPSDKEIIVISDNEKDAFRLAAYLDKKGYHSAVVHGGFKAWDKYVLNPKSPGSDADDKAFSEYAKRVSVSNFLQGKGIGAGAVTKKRKKKAFKRVIKAAAGGGC